MITRGAPASGPAFGPGLGGDDHPAEHLHQVLLFGWSKRSEELVGGAVEGAGRSLLHGLAPGCEVEGVGTPVRRVPAPDHDALLLELIDQLDHRGAVDSELL